MAALNQACDERPGVAGSVAIVVVGSEPKRLSSPPVGMRRTSRRHTPSMRRLRPIGSAIIIPSRTSVHDVDTLVLTKFLDEDCR
jgi:hypothetical protein